MNVQPNDPAHPPAATARPHRTGLIAFGLVLGLGFGLASLVVISANGGSITASPNGLTITVNGSL